MREFKSWSDACDALLDGACDEVVFLGNVWRRDDALRSIGHDGAVRLGLIDEYRAKILGP